MFVEGYNIILVFAKLLYVLLELVVELIYMFIPSVLLYLLSYGCEAILFAIAYEYLDDWLQNMGDRFHPEIHAFFNNI